MEQEYHYSSISTPMVGMSMGTPYFGTEIDIQETVRPSTVLCYCVSLDALKKDTTIPKIVTRYIITICGVDLPVQNSWKNK